MNTEKILVIGGKHLRYHVAALDDDPSYEITHMRVKDALAFAEKEKDAIDMILIELRGPHYGVFDFTETENEEITGAVVIKRLLPLCPNAIFLLFGGAGVRAQFQKNPQVKILSDMLDYTIQELCDEVAKYVKEKSS